MPKRLVRLLNTGFGSQGFEFVYETEFAAARDEDAFWATAFRRFGGEVVLSGDKQIAKKPHQIIAFKENELICFFCDKRWGNQDVIYQVAHMMFWWPRIQTQIEICKPRDCWWVPMAIRHDQFRKVELPADVEAAAAEARQAS
jgi:PIN like domain